jgi:hypothetical protein
MVVILNPIRMHTTLPGPMSMHTLEPISIRIHIGIMATIIILIKERRDSYIADNRFMCPRRPQGSPRGGV